MEAEELRIGNYIIVNDKIQLVCELPLPSNCTSVNTKPIPLTEEILLKCGIVNGEIKIKGRIVEIYQHFGDDKIWFFNIEDHLTVEINYLHQLQNLYFALAQEELPINL